MGDLRLLPFDADGGNDGISFSHTLFELEQDDALFREIRKLDSMLVPKRFKSFSGRASDGATGYGKTVEDPYGDPVRYVLSGDLVRLEIKKSCRTVAAWAYLACLPPETKVALYWH